MYQSTSSQACHTEYISLLIMSCKDTSQYLTVDLAAWPYYIWNEFLCDSMINLALIRMMVEEDHFLDRHEPTMELFHPDMCDRQSSFIKHSRHHGTLYFPFKKKTIKPNRHRWIHFKQTAVCTKSPNTMLKIKVQEYCV